MKRLAPLILTLPLLLASCAESSDNSMASPQTESMPLEAPTIKVHPVNEAIKASGVTLTLHSLTESDHLMLNAQGVKPGVKPEEREDPVEGGKFITVNTTVENTGTESMDLTCGFGVQAHLFNKDEQKYDPIGSLYRLPGNPECSDSLNPGFSTTMMWTFEVPEAMEATEFGFADPDTHYNDLTLIDVLNAPVAEETSTNEVLSPVPTTAITVEQPTAHMPTPQQAPPVVAAPTFVQCWEDDAAQMSDGSIVYDPVNCDLTNDEELKQSAEEYLKNNPDPYADPYRADGCVGPAAVCGYYDESGNPIWFDKMTGERSPRYYDENGQPTMEAP